MITVTESSIGTMGRNWREGEHGKEHSRLQHKKRKSSGRWKICHIRVGVKWKERWNKKKGIQETSKKHSKDTIWWWCN